MVVFFFWKLDFFFVSFLSSSFSSRPAAPHRTSRAFSCKASSAVALGKTEFPFFPWSFSRLWFGSGFERFGFSSLLGLGLRFCFLGRSWRVYRNGMEIFS